MLTSIELSHVQDMNLGILVTIQTMLRANPADACYQFGIPLGQADSVTALSFDDLKELVVNLGDESVVEIKHSLWSLLSAPRALTGLLASTHRSETTLAVSAFGAKERV